MANDGTQSYQSFNVIIGGHLFTGFARGDSYNAVYDEDQFQKLVGNRGLGAWVRLYGLGATITLELMAASSDNAKLSALFTADFNSNRGFGAPLVVRDSNGLDVQTAEMVRVMKIPDNPRGDTVATRTWTLGTTKLITAYGGNLGPLIGTLEQAEALAAALPPLPVAA